MRKIDWAMVLAGLLLVSACGGGEDDCRLTPEEGSLSGYYPVSINCPDRHFSAEAISSVKFGENSAIKIQIIDPHTVSATVQGASEPGQVDVLIDGEGGGRVFKSAFTYLPAADSVFDRMFALGASWTMGVQSGSLNPTGQLRGPAAQLARRVGAYFPLPLVKMAAPEPVQVSSLINNCSSEDMVNIKLGGISGVIDYMIEQPDLDLAIFREDPDILPHNLAIAGSMLHDVIYGGGANRRIDIAFLENLVYFPRGPISEIFLTPELGSPLEFAEAQHPSLVMITDLFGNDMFAAVFKEGLPDVSLATPLAEFQPDIRVLLSRLSGTGAEVFIANLGHPGSLPWLKEKIKVLEHEGYTRAEIDQTIAGIETVADQYSGALVQEAAPYSNIHIVDMAAAAARIEHDGYTVGNTVLTNQMFGGLISLDGIHPSQTGYALYANLFLEAINSALGLNLPMVDLAEVLADDPYSPSAIRAAGLDPDLCQ
ncbi:MAG: SGNH/GDSL hydrolase family protein [bacterium]|nr:SGNH/GDSL hydrolase family protein [bacterium]